VTSAVLVLVAGSEVRTLEPAWIRRALELCGGKPHWLAPGEAVEFAVPPGREATLREELAAAFADAPLDWALLSGVRRRKRVLVCDMDSTVIDVECIDELADYAGVRDRIAAVTQKAMAGEIDFEASLRLRVGLLEGVRLRDIDEICRERIHLVPGARTMVRTMQAHGAFCALVSGGFTEFSRYVRLLAGFDMDVANRLEVVDGRLTGVVLPPLHGPETKLETLLRLSHKFAAGPAEAVAVGDGANDLAMIRAAGLGVAFRPHAILRRAADAVIAHADLRAVLYFQGYRREEFVEDDAP